MNLIVAVDKHWAIGKNGQLLVTIPADMKLFREETIGKVIVMGRKTLESFPGGQPLHSRTNIVLTNNLDYKVKGALVFHCLDDVLKELEKYNQDDIFIIGGESIYRQFLPYCTVAHVTYIDYEYQADTYFPDLDKDDNWKLVLESEEETYFDLCYAFRMYKKQEKIV